MSKSASQSPSRSRCQARDACGFLPLCSVLLEGITAGQHNNISIAEHYTFYAAILHLLSSNITPAVKQYCIWCRAILLLLPSNLSPAGQHNNISIAEHYTFYGAILHLLSSNTTPAVKQYCIWCRAILLLLPSNPT